MSTLDTSQLIALAAALGWASGLRVYAVLLIVGLAGYAGWVDLPSGLRLLQHPLMLAASGFMFVAEFFADKIPGVDTLWDTMHTVIRIPAGAALAAAVFGTDHATAAGVAAVLGAALAASSHFAKATTRAAVNTSPEPFSNIGLSLAGDATVPAALWLALAHPWVFFPLLALALAIMGVLLWKLGHFVVQLLRRLGGGAGGRAPTVT